MSLRDRIAATAFLLLGGYVAGAGMALGTGTLQKPGAGLQPLVLGVLFMVLGMIYLTAAFRKPRGGVSPWSLALCKRPLMAGAAILLYWLGLTRLGFPLTTFLFLIGWLWLIERESWCRILVVSVSVTVCLYLVFTIILRIRLPLGSLFQ